ncbi:MAG TPA: nuclear transport factor 2 family protein, partial [Bryobacteraceae bacterium]|nr:nuclear transport factor 2 family protein [Bryobacteraceae bacterium]
SDCRRSKIVARRVAGAFLKVPSPTQARWCSGVTRRPTAEGARIRWASSTEFVAYVGPVKTFALALLIVFLCSGSSAEDQAAIRALERNWDVANLSGNSAALDSLFADSFIMTDSAGVVRDKQEVVGELKAGRIKYTAAKSDELRIILHGDAAVVSGRWTGTFTHNGKTTSLRERFTNFYARVKGQWRCVASHGSNLQ